MSTVQSLCLAARSAQPALASAPTAVKNAVLLATADLLGERSDVILAANERDLAEAGERGLSPAMIDRLRLTEARIAGIAAGVRDIAALSDPIGQVSEQSRRPNGLRVGRMRIPLGVIAMIFESRPNVVIDAGALCIKSANAAILKGGREATHSNQVLASILRDALELSGLPRDAVVLLTDRSQVGALLQQAETVDLVIPRGGEGLIRYVTENSRIPVVQHYKGTCHVYVDEGADLEMAADIAFNSKVHRPGVCNAMETLLVAEAEAEAFLPVVGARLQGSGVELRGCERTRAILGDAVALATEEDWHAEYLDLILAVRVVTDMDQAIGHIRAYGSDHTEAIVTRDWRRANEFVDLVPSSAVMVNASTRFNDGGELGLGAEIGISTSRLHAFGPMGLRELTTTKFVVFGDGHVR